MMVSMLKEQVWLQMTGGKAKQGTDSHADVPDLLEAVSGRKDPEIDVSIAKNYLSKSKRGLPYEHSSI